MSAPRRPRFAFHLATVAVLCLTQFAAFAHLTLVSHRVCAEHGELIHEGEGHASDNALRAFSASATRNSATAVIRAQRGSDEHGHEHCSLAAHRRERAVLSAAPVQVACDFPCAAPVFASTSSASASGVAVLRLAPKTSPPA